MAESTSYNPFRRYRAWRRRREDEFIVTINKPRMKIIGKKKCAKVYPRFKYIAFLGIPYALSPVGKRRFQPPESLPEPLPHLPIEVWKAYKKPNPCAQIHNRKFIGSEDCLYLNVFTPKKPIHIPQLLPVLVYIHGGGFSEGESGDTNPENMMKEGLVVVIINYRLGIFGFLNMRSENCRGNAGLKDQVMALQWVHDNIAAFKGNPGKVTICGQSAGGSCVNFHMISPMSKGLFHQAIVMSGGVHCPWGYGGHAKHVIHLFKDAMGHKNELRHVVVQLMKDKSTKDLLDFGNEVMMSEKRLRLRKMTVHFKPSVEYIKDGAFLSDTVENLMAIAKPVPTMAGIVKQEGYSYFRAYPRDFIATTKKKDGFIELVKDLIWKNLGWRDLADVEKHFERFKALYFPLMKEERNIKEEQKEKKLFIKEEQKQHLATLIADLQFRRFYDNFKIGNLLHDGRPPLYVYEFDFSIGQPIFAMPKEDSRPIVRVKAAEHGDDFVFLFGPKYLENLLLSIRGDYFQLYRTEVESVKINMRNLWGSFCRSGIPKSHHGRDAHVDWIQHTENAPAYLHIGRSLYLRNARLNKKRWSALNEICQLESTVPSLATSPLTPDKEFRMFRLLHPELGLPSSQTLVEEVKPSLPPTQVEEVKSSSSPTPVEIVRLSSSSTPVDEVKPSSSQDLVEEVEPSSSSTLVEKVKPSSLSKPVEEVKPASPALAGEVEPSSLPTPVEEVKPFPAPALAEEVELSSLPSKVEELKPFSSPTLVEEVKPSSLPTPVEEVE